MRAADGAGRLDIDVSPENYTMLDYQREFCPPEGMLKVLGYLGDRYGGVEGYVRAVGLSDLEIGRLRSAVVEED